MTHTVAAKTTPATVTTLKKQIAAAQKAQTNINNAIKKAKLKTADKNKKLAEVKTYDVYIARAQAYQTAGCYSACLAQSTLTMLKLHNSKKFVGKVYGSTVRNFLVDYYCSSTVAKLK